MSLPEKTCTKPNAATLALWRAAESDDVDELAAVLPRVADINARNEHGVTALMRAAQNGHVKIVRALLDRGADANLKRNDQFTALALAAFFGHTEVVRTLMEHGADSQAATRYGTSPHMWATARTFNEVVTQLKKPAPAPPINPVKVQERVQKAPAAVPAVVRTLKDPPEIWDLVHEAPRGFNARATFLARLQSMKTGVAFRMVAAVVLIATCAVGVLVLRNAQARSERSSDLPSTAPAVRKSVPNESTKSDRASAPAALLAPAAGPAVAPTASEPAVSEPVVNENDKAIATRKSDRRPARFSSHRVEPEQKRGAAANPDLQPVVAPIEKPTVRVSAEPVIKTRTSSALSPQLIAPVKSSAPKAKVIQWP